MRTRRMRRASERWDRLRETAEDREQKVRYRKQKELVAERLEWE